MFKYLLKNKTKAALLLMFIFFQNPFSTYAEENKLSFDSLEEEIKSLMRSYRIPGGSIAIVKEGKLIHNQCFGYADRIRKQLVKPSHKFRVASVSKAITAIAILKLVETKRIHLDDPIFDKNGILSKEYSPNSYDPRYSKITVRHLLEHSGGWDRDIAGDPLFNGLNNPNIEGNTPFEKRKSKINYIINHTLQQPLSFDPGSRYSYSNFGYILLGRVIEAITGTPYEQYVYENILSPIGAQNTQIGYKEIIRQAKNEVIYYDDYEAASGIDYFGEGYISAPYCWFDVEAMDACGGWISTATDLAKLLTAIDGLSNRKDILGYEAISTMLHRSKISYTGALGWSVDHNGSAWCIGSFPGTASMISLRKDGVGWVVLFNSKPESFDFFLELEQLMNKKIDEGLASYYSENEVLEEDLFEDQEEGAEDTQTGGSSASIAYYKPIRYYPYSYKKLAFDFAFSQLEDVYVTTLSGSVFLNERRTNRRGGSEKRALFLAFA